MRRAARERFDGMNVNWAGIADLEGEAAAEAFGIIAGEVEGQVSWWRGQLQAQRYEPDQVERPVSEYRRAAMRDLQRRLEKEKRAA